MFLMLEIIFNFRVKPASYLSNQIEANHDLKHPCRQWIRSNRLSLNGGKTKIIIFRNRFQQINKKLNFRVSGEKINLTSSVKYLGVYLTPTLT